MAEQLLWVGGILPAYVRNHMTTIIWIIPVVVLVIMLGWLAKNFGWDSFKDLTARRAVRSLRHQNYVVLENFTYVMHVIREVEGIVFEKTVLGVNADYGDMVFTRSSDNVATLSGTTVGVEYVLTLIGDGNLQQIGTKQGTLSLKIPTLRRGLFSGPKQQEMELSLNLNSTFTPTDRAMLTEFFTNKKRLQVA